MKEENVSGLREQVTKNCKLLPFLSTLSGSFLSLAIFIPDGSFFVDRYILFFCTIVTWAFTAWVFSSLGVSTIQLKLHTAQEQVEIKKILINLVENQKPPATKDHRPVEKKVTGDSAYNWVVQEANFSASAGEEDFSSRFH